MKLSSKLLQPLYLSMMVYEMTIFSSSDILTIKNRSNQGIFDSFLTFTLSRLSQHCINNTHHLDSKSSTFPAHRNTIRHSYYGLSSVPESQPKTIGHCCLCNTSLVLYPDPPPKRTQHHTMAGLAVAMDSAKS